MGDSMAPKVKGFVRFKKVAGKHHMYCPVRERKVVLGPNREDGDIAYLTPAGVPGISNESWECVDKEDHVAEASEQEMQEKAGDPEGTLVIKERTGGGYDVENTATGKYLNTAPLTKDQADAVVAGFPVEQAVYDNPPRDDSDEESKPPGDGEGDDIICPGGHEFGKDHDEHEDCDECTLAKSCQAKKESGE